MKKVVVFMLILFSLSTFAGIYKVYFINGGLLVLKEKPDFSKEKIIGITPDGKKIMFRKKLVDFEKTKKANEKKKSEKKEKKKKSIKVIPSKPQTTYKKNNRVLIITEETIGRKKEDNKKKKEKSKNPYMAWKDEVNEIAESGEDSYSETEGMSEEEAKAYWRGKFIKVNKAIEQTSKKIKNIQSELNRLLTEKLNTDDNIVIMQINAEMEKLEKKKKQLEEKLKNLKKEKEKLKDEARRAGALPGWYRDLI